MANDKTYDRHVNIWINGKEVKNDLASMEKELFKMRNEWKRMTVGTQEWIDKGKEIQKLKGIVDEHNASVRKTPGFLDKIKGSFGMLSGVMATAFAAFQSLKGVIEATDNLSDKFTATLGGMKEGLMSVKQALATGDFTNFFKNLADAYKEGRRYAETLDAIGDSARALSLEESKVADRILELKVIQMDQRKSNEEQIKAGEEIERLQSELADKRVVQARKNLDNELSLARDRSKLTDEEIRGLLNQDQAYMSLLESGQKYVELQNKLKLMQAGTVTPYGTVMSASQDEIRAVAREIESMGMAGEYAAKIYVGWGNVIEDQRDKLVGYENDVAAAKRSATEDILRTITRLNAARASEANEARKSVEKIKSYYEKYGLNEATAEQGGAAYDPNEWMRKEVEELRKKEEQEREKELKDQEKHEQKKQAAYLESLQQGSEAAKEEWEKRKQAEQEYMIETIALYQDYAISVGEIMGQAIAEGDNLLKAAAKAALNIAFDELTRLARIWEAQIYAKSIVQYGIIGGTIRATAISALIEGAIGAARAVVMKNLWTGGYTGAGGKYEPRGIVHAGEWVANADMVASPTYGPVIRALENVQRSGKSFAEGGMVDGSQTGKSESSIIASDPELKQILRSVGRILYKLDQDGVSARFGYKDIDNIRKGMTALEDIESNVSIA